MESPPSLATILSLRQDIFSASSFPVAATHRKFARPHLLGGFTAHDRAKFLLSRILLSLEGFTRIRLGEAAITPASCDFFLLGHFDGYKFVGMVPGSVYFAVPLDQKLSSSGRLPGIANSTIVFAPNGVEERSDLNFLRVWAGYLCHLD